MELLLFSYRNVWPGLHSFLSLRLSNFFVLLLYFLDFLPLILLHFYCVFNFHYHIYPCMSFFPTAYFVMYLLAPITSQCKKSLTSSLLNLSHLLWSLSFSLDFPQMSANSWVAYSYVRAGRTDTWRSSGHWVRSVTLGFAGWRFG